MGDDGFRMIQMHYTYCALYFYYYISSISDHQILDPGGWNPCFKRTHKSEFRVRSISALMVTLNRNNINSSYIDDYSDVDFLKLGSGVIELINQTYQLAVRQGLARRATNLEVKDKISCYNLLSHPICVLHRAFVSFKPSIWVNSHIRRLCWISLFWIAAVTKHTGVCS